MSIDEFFPNYNSDTCIEGRREKKNDIRCKYILLNKGRFKASDLTVMTDHIIDNHTDIFNKCSGRRIRPFNKWCIYVLCWSLKSWSRRPKWCVFIFHFFYPLPKLTWWKIYQSISSFGLNETYRLSSKARDVKNCTSIIHIPYLKEELNL